MRFRVTVQKLNVTDRRTGALQYLPSRAFGAAGDNEPNLTFLTLAMTFRVIQSNSSQFIVTNEEASGQNREKITKQILNKWTRSVKIGEKWQI